MMTEQQKLGELEKIKEMTESKYVTLETNIPKKITIYSYKTTRQEIDGETKPKLECAVNKEDDVPCEKTLGTFSRLLADELRKVFANNVDKDTVTVSITRRGEGKKTKYEVVQVPE